MNTEIKKSNRLNDVSYDIRGALSVEADRLMNNGERIHRLNIGNPAPFGFRMPDSIREAFVEGLAKSQGYSDSKGLLSARQAIAAFCSENGIPGVSENDIYTGNGVSELIAMSMQALLNNGDEILIPSPDYPLWTASVTLSGGKAVHYVCDESAGWMPDIADMEKKITDRTRGIVIINPNNPTGAVYPREILGSITAMCRRHNLILFSDEIYDRLVMDGMKHIYAASVDPEILTVCFNGLSKSHLMAGLRCGWMCICGNKRNAADYIEGLDTLASMRLCSNVPAQSVIPAAISSDSVTRSLFEPGGRIWEQRKAVCDSLAKIPGVSAVTPHAAFYIFPRIDLDFYDIQDDEAFALGLLREKKILITHGTGFNWKSPDHFRIVYLPEKEELTAAVGDIGDYLQKYRR